MSEEQRALEALERELAELGPVMLTQERLEAEEPRPAFAAELRARLVGEQPAATGSPARPVGPRPIPFRRRALHFAGLGGIALVAAVLALLFLRSPQKLESPGVHTALFTPPTPTSADLTKSYPLLGGLGGGGFAQPSLARIEYPPGGPYPGRLRFTVGPLPAPPATVKAYRLAGPTFDLPRLSALARALAIHGPVRHENALETIGSVRIQSRFAFVASGQGQQLHSLSISSRSGQLIYHDFGLTPNTGALGLPASQQAAAIAAARAWLTRLGWPGASLPLQSQRFEQNGPGFVSLSFGWPGVGRTDLPLATIWVVRGGGIAEALLQPPVQAGSTLPAQTLAPLVRRLQLGRIPYGVESMMVAQPPNGTARLQAVSVAHIFSATPAGRIYLIPVYRFAGTAHFPGVNGPRQWFALAPAAGTGGRP